MDGVNLTLLAAYASVMLTDPWHHALWHLSFTGQMAVLHDGPLRELWIRATYALNLLYLVLMTVWVVRERGLRRRQAELILLAILISWVGVLLARSSATLIPAPICGIDRSFE